MQSGVISGSTASLRPTGIGRFFSAAFLSVWLCGWLVGEVVAGGALIGIFASMAGVREPWLPPGAWDFARSGPAAFVILFLIVWLTFWTFGGIAAATQLLRLVAGEDSFALEGAGVRVTRRAGPFRRTTAFDRSAIRRIRLRSRDRAVVVDTDKGTRVLSELGSASERESVAEWLKGYLGLTSTRIAESSGMPPVTWEVTVSGDTTHMRKVKPRVRSVRAIIAWVVTGAAGLAWFFSIGEDAAGIAALALTALLAVGAAMSTWGRREWIARPGELTFRRTFAAWTSEQSFRSGRLEVTHRRDSDNDSWYDLVVTDGERRKVVHHELHDCGEIDDLGRWLAARTGFPFTPGA